MPKAYTVESVRVGTGGGIGLRSAGSANTKSSLGVEVKLNRKSSCGTTEDVRVQTDKWQMDGCQLVYSRAECHLLRWSRVLSLWDHTLRDQRTGLWVTLSVLGVLLFVGSR